MGREGVKGRGEREISELVTKDYEVFLNYGDGCTTL